MTTKKATHRQNQTKKTRSVKKSSPSQVKLSRQQEKQQYGPGCPIWMGRLFGSAIACDRFIIMVLLIIFLSIASFLIIYTSYMTLVTLS
ncbi:hypothetical protein IJJ08_03475 [bacterium]|nr:hypothetical protein [bacterium]